MSPASAPLSSRLSVFLAILLFFPVVFTREQASGQSYIETSATQNGGVAPADGGGLVISHATNAPSLTVTGGATSHPDMKVLVVGNAADETGHLSINNNNGSTFGTSFAGTGDVWPLTSWGNLGTEAAYNGGSYLGLHAGATGTATVSGAGSKWVSEALAIGYSGTGTMTVQEGGQVSTKHGIIGNTDGSTGTATVDGNGSEWTSELKLIVGNSGTGVLNIQNGGRVSVSGLTSFNVGDAAGSHGTTNVSGAGSQLFAEYMAVGVQNGSHGELHVRNGGTVTGLNAVIGYNTGTTALAVIDGGGSSIDYSTGFLIVGHSGPGELRVQNGAAAASGYGTIGWQVGSNGTAVVDGPGSHWKSEHMGIGEEGTGSLSIQGGGTMQSTDGLIGVATGAAGTVTVTGPNSKWTVDGHLDLGGVVHAFTLDTATLTRSTNPGDGGGWTEIGGKAVLSIQNQGVVEAGEGLALIHSEAKLTGNGGKFIGDVYNNGVVAPGNSIGTLTIDGDYTQMGGGVLEIELGSDLSGLLSDRLVISGIAHLGGSLDVSLFGGFNLVGGETFEILFATGGIDGTFDGLAHDSLVKSFENADLFVSYSANSVSLHSISSVPEPSSILLFLGATAVAPLWRRRVSEARKSQPVA